jgi:hypothetical protein
MLYLIGGPGRCPRSLDNVFSGAALTEALTLIPMALLPALAPLGECPNSLHGKSVRQYGKQFPSAQFMTSGPRSLFQGDDDTLMDYEFEVHVEKQVPMSDFSAVVNNIIASSYLDIIMRHTCRALKSCPSSRPEQPRFILEITVLSHYPTPLELLKPAREIIIWSRRNGWP